MDSPTPIWLRRFTKFVALSTLFLIFAGAMVTSTGSGLAVPDWPLSYGMLMPPMVAGIFYEHGHRMIATFVGFLTVVQAIWLQRREPKRFLRILGWVALALVITQGLFGGLTVIFLLPKAISIAHAGLAEIFFCTTVAIAFFASKSFASIRKSPLTESPVGVTTLLVAVVYVQILAGALVRHLGAGVAIPDFPLSFGKVIPDFTSLAIAANFAHRAGALLVTVVAIAVLSRCLRSGSVQLRRLAVLLTALIAFQIFLGAHVVWSGNGDTKIYHTLGGEEAMRHSMITSLHVVTGAATLAVSFLLSLTARAAARPLQRSAPALVPTEAAA